MSVIYQVIQSAFRGRILACALINNGHINVDEFFADSFSIFERKQLVLLSEHTLFKTYATFHVDLMKFAGAACDEEVHQRFYIQCKGNVIDTETDLRAWFDVNIVHVCKVRLDEFMAVESGWSLHAIDSLHIYNNYHEPIRGSSYIELPRNIALKNAIVNVQNLNDEMCFMWAVLSAIHDVQENPENVGSYMEFMDQLDFSGIRFPVEVSDIARFEAQNDWISINVYVVNENGIFGVHRLTSQIKEKHIHLLLLHAEINDTNAIGPLNSHFCWIKDLNRLLKKQASKHNGPIFLCDRCLHYFYSDMKLRNHLIDCMKQNECAVRLPPVSHNVLRFTKFNKKLRAPFCIYADLESILLPANEGDAFCVGGNTHAYQKHEACAIGFYLKCSFDDSISFFRSYTGADCIEWFCKQLYGIYELVHPIYMNIVPMHMSAADEKAFKEAKFCHICLKSLQIKHFKDEAIVRDHSHFTGKYRGAAHAQCNIGYQESRSIPVIFHNLSGYDSHFIIRELATSFKGDISILPHNDQQYISFTKTVKASEKKNHRLNNGRTLIRFKFIDSFKFLDASLDTLARDLPSNEKKNLHQEFNNINDSNMRLLERKGIFPYDFLDSWEKLHCTELPAREGFYSRLSESHITDEEYQHACRVWNDFAITNLGEYMELYLKTDILLLADIFESFRATLSGLFDLDPANFVTLPSFSFEAMLKYTGVEIELLSNIDHLLFVERAIRGGITQCSKRYARANNQYMDDFDETEKKSFLLYIDANALYADVMLNSPLPIDSFEFIQAENISQEYLLMLLQDQSIGCFIEADLEYPEHLHDHHKDYPLCAEKMIPPRGREEAREYEYPGSSIENEPREKLMLTLYNKKRYVMHHSMFQFVIQQGLVVKKIHRVLRFRQSKFLSSYIAVNTLMRQQSKNEFEKTLWKKNSNILFGKCCERVRSRRNIKLRSQWDGRYGAKNLIARPEFKRVTIFDENLVAVELSATNVLMDKPCFIGAAILDISKLTMAKFHYDFIVREYGNKCEMLYTDTDSFIYMFTGVDDIYAEIKKNICRFDTSDYPRDNIYGIPLKNKKVPGLFKDENCGQPMSEFVGLRAKMYSTRVRGQDAMKKAKGVKRYVLRKTITFNDFYQCIRENCIISREQNSIRSKNHDVYSIRQRKIALSPYDDKRCILADNINTLPWGHRDI